MIGARAQSRRHHGRRQARRRRGVAFIGTGALAAALASIWSVASLNGVDIASAAVTKAQSIADLMSRRSPGERTQALLNKTKHKRHYAVLAERSPEEVPPVLLGTPTAPAFLPAALTPPPVLALAQAAPIFPAAFAPPLGGVFFSPGPGGGGPGGGTGSPGGGGGGPPAQPPPTQPTPPSAPPAVPEPATWAMLILGFGVTGVAFRRRRSVIAASFAR